MIHPFQITMQPAQPEELNTVMDILDDAARWLHSRGIKQWPYPTPPSEWPRMARHIATGEVYLARLEDGRAVGTLRFERKDPELWHDDAGIAGYVHDFAIHDSVRGQGIGAAMLEWAKGHIRARGKQLLRLDCVANNPALNRYYRDIGLTYRGQGHDRNYIGSLYEVAL